MPPRRCMHSNFKSERGLGLSACTRTVQQVHSWAPKACGRGRDDSTQQPPGRPPCCPQKLTRPACSPETSAVQGQTVSPAGPMPFRER